MRTGKRRELHETDFIDALAERLEHLKARVLAKVEHPFRVIKCQFGHVKVRYRGLTKCTARLHTLLVLFNPWMGRRTLVGVQA